MWSWRQKESPHWWRGDPGSKGLKVKSTLKTEDEGPGRDITKKKINKLDWRYWDLNYGSKFGAELEIETQNTKQMEEQGNY